MFTNSPLYKRWQIQTCTSSMQACPVDFLQRGISLVDYIGCGTAFSPQWTSCTQLYKSGLDTLHGSQMQACLWRYALKSAKHINARSSFAIILYPTNTSFKSIYMHHHASYLIDLASLLCLHCLQAETTRFLWEAVHISTAMQQSNQDPGQTQAKTLGRQCYQPCWLGWG